MSTLAEYVLKFMDMHWPTPERDRGWGGGEEFLRWWDSLENQERNLLIDALKFIVAKGQNAGLVATILHYSTSLHFWRDLAEQVKELEESKRFGDNEAVTSAITNYRASEELARRGLQVDDQDD